MTAVVVVRQVFSPSKTIPKNSGFWDVRKRKSIVIAELRKTDLYVFDNLTLLHSGWPKLHTILAFLSVIGFRKADHLTAG